MTNKYYHSCRFVNKDSKTIIKQIKQHNSWIMFHCVLGNMYIQFLLIYSVDTESWQLDGNELM